jgi:mono/diheme cytochrome c family protein
MKKILFYALAGMFLGPAIMEVMAAQGSEYEQGEKLFNEKCQICHGKKGDGNGPAAVAFSPRPANFSDPKFWQKFNDAIIADTIRHGHGMMPAFDLTPDQIKAIIDYMEHTFKKEKKG